MLGGITHAEPLSQSEVTPCSLLGNLFFIYSISFFIVCYKFGLVICWFINWEKHTFSLWIGQGKGSSKEKFGLENWVSMTANLLALHHCNWGFFWEHHSRSSLGHQYTVQKVGTSARRAFDTSWPLMRWFQRRPLFLESHVEPAVQAGSIVHFRKHIKMAKEFIPTGRESVFYMVPPSLKWAMAFLPMRLKRPRKAKVLQSC
jgi:hypothetical protein